LRRWRSDIRLVASDMFAFRQTLRKKAEETRVSSAFIYAFCGAKSHLLKTE
jgi:hypothetical protein